MDDQAVGAGELAGSIRRIPTDEQGHARGFGFIRGANGTDYFFHKSALVRTLRFDTLEEGDAVVFVPGEKGERGERADRVWLAQP